MKVSIIKGICLLSVLSILVGSTACGSQETAGIGGASVPASSAAPDIKSISIWHIWTSDTDSNKVSFEAAAESFAAVNPDIKLEVEAIETEIYKSKIRLAIATNEAPDVFFSWGGGFSKPFVDSGKVLDVYSYLDADTKSRLMESALGSQTYDGKIYGLPFMVSVICLFANREMFEQYEIKLPETYEDLLAAVRSFRVEGITPATVAEIELWPGMLWYNALALRTAGLETSMAALEKRATFDQPAFTEAADKLDELVDAGMFQKNYMKTGYAEAMEPVRQGRVPMILMGSWACSGFEDDTSAVKGKMVPLKFPLVPGGKGTIDEYIGGAIDCWMVSAGASDRAASVKTAAGIAEGLCKEGYERNMLIPIWDVVVDESKISPLMRQIEETVKDARGFVPSWDTFLEGSDAQTHLKLVAGLLAQSVAPEEFGARMQEINKGN